MTDERADRELLRRFKRTIVLMLMAAVAGFVGAILNSVPCELAFVAFFVLAVIAGWISAVRVERDDS